MMDLGWGVILILVGGWGSGRLFKAFGLPDVLGMTLWGVAISFFLGPQMPPLISELAPFLKSLAMVIILLRAGLGLKRKTLARIGGTAVLLALLPMLFEAATWFLMGVFFLELPWAQAGVLAFLISAVSPAVVVPSMLDLQEQGLNKNDVPTLILAGASLDDVLAITAFTIFLGFSTGEGEGLFSDLLKIPFSLVLGIVLGFAFGLVLLIVFRRFHSNIRATEKTLLLLGFSLALFQVGDLLQVAALLGIMATGFLLLEKAPGIAQELASKLSKSWVFAAIILFVLIGMAVDVEKAFSAGVQGLFLLGIGLVARSVGVFIATAFGSLNLKERLFCIISYLPKATVQAALGTVALDQGLESGTLILTIAVLSIVVTAPLGLLGIRIFGPKLLASSFDDNSKVGESS